MNAVVELVRDSAALPDGWRSLRLCDVATLGGGATPSRAKSTYWDDATVPWATPSDITSLPTGVSTIASTESMVSERALAECSLSLNPPGTVLMTSRATIGFAAINTAPMTTNQGFITFAAGRDLDPVFLLYWLIAQRPNLVAAAGGSTFKELSRGTAKLLPILLPPLDEQRRIAEVLRSVDEALAWNVETAQHLWALRKLALAEFFVASETEEAELTVLGRLRRGWRIIAADAVCEAVIDCKNRTPPITDDGPAVVRTMNVRRGRFVRVNLARTDTQSFDEWTKRGKPQVGDVLITREAPIGEVCAVPQDEPVCLGQRMMLYRPRQSDLHSGYLLYALQSAGVQEYLLRLAGGSTVGHVRVGDIRNLPLPVPDMETQVSIAKAMTDIDRALDHSEGAVSRLQSLKSAIASDLLSGRVRMPAPVAATSGNSVPAAFKRAAFAAEVVHQLHNDSRFGSVKHEKIVHLCELHLDLHKELDRHAYKEAAGPYDPKARRSVEAIFAKQKWFKAHKPDGKRVVYTPLEKCGAHKSYFDRYFGDRQPAIQSIIDLLRPLDTERCEIIATLYAVWNDFLIDGVQPTDDAIVASVLQWHPKKATIAKSRWLAALPWMRGKGLIPTGKGEKTRAVGE
ncbi:restriction endonuclease subunit S [Caenibius sp. WL]|uniref:restriction endonuclease subunit S n=1 Tax=Caenibius sp. WL TaxID=2872646 RepID=UPI001C99AF8B|nr:restriction endonuclease subunit S [Caenibius sp. WL]QZP07229.1 restriction endonuclease subunit S [Caenibius sp. WL]